MSDTAGHLLNEALAHHRAGRLGEAEGLYRKVLAGEPDQPDALHLLGLVAIQANKPGVAVQLIERAIEVRPAFPQALSNLGFVYQAVGRWSDAIAAYRKALELQPDLPEAQLNLGNALVESGKADEAIEVLERAVSLRSDHPNVHNSLGSALRAAGRIDEAMVEFRRVLELNPDHAEAHNNLANALRDTDRQDEAIGHFHRAIVLLPEYAQCYNNLGGALEELGQYDQAIQSYRRAIEKSPQFPMAHVNLGIALLRNGQFEQGWREYEWRYQDPEVAPLLKQSQRPVWEPSLTTGGSGLEGRTLLVHAEQGFGDTIQFSRYLPLIPKNGGRVIFRCHPELLSLLKGIGGVDELIPMDQPIPEHDLQCPLLSLPRILRTTEATIPAPIPYLRAEPAKVANWRSRLGEQGPERKIGVVWAGRARYRNDRLRSIAPELLSGLSALPGVKFVNLKVGKAIEGGLEVLDWTAELKDFSDTAALVEALDLVISVDTSVAHLAGALGKPVWVLLPFSPDWRWMLNRTDSPWYPTARLFRERTRGDWRTVVKEVIEELGRSRT